MQFRPYDILTQLIPGILIVGVFLLVTEHSLNWQELGTGSFGFIVVLSFIVGYLVNGIGHMLGSLMAHKLSDRVKELYDSKKKLKGIWRIISIFTKLKHESKSEDLKGKSFSDLFDSIKTDEHAKLDWLNQDKKFARSLIITSISLLLEITILPLNELASNYLLQMIIGVVVLFLISFYRYVQCSVDYAIWIIKFNERRK